MQHEEVTRLHATTGPYRAGVIYCGAWAAAGLALASTSRVVGDPYADVVIVAGLMIAAACGPVAFLCCLSPGPGRIYLDLKPEGFHEQSVRSSRTFRWRDFDHFGVMSDSEGGPEVGFRFSDGYEGKRPRHPFGLKPRFHGTLYDTYGMPARDLTDLLNGWRVRHGPKPAVAKEPLDELL